MIFFQRLTIKVNSASVITAEGATIKYNDEELVLAAGQGWASPKSGKIPIA